MDEQEFLSIDETARFLGLPINTVKIYVEKNEIPHQMSGGKIQFRRDQIQNWSENQLEKKASFLPDNVSFKKVLHKSRIRFLDNIYHKKDVIDSLADCFLHVSGVKDKKELVDAFLYREHLMSTGIGLGVAVPHVRLPDVKSLSLAVGISRNDIVDYEALDNQPVRIIMMVVAGKGQHQDYIRLLGYLSSKFKNSITRNSLINADSVDQVFQLLTERTVH